MVLERDGHGGMCGLRKDGTEDGSPGPVVPVWVNALMCVLGKLYLPLFLCVCGRLMLGRPKVTGGSDLPGVRARNKTLDPSLQALTC